MKKPNSSGWQWLGFLFRGQPEDHPLERCFTGWRLAPFSATGFLRCSEHGIRSKKLAAAAFCFRAALVRVLEVGTSPHVLTILATCQYHGAFREQRNPSGNACASSGMHRLAQIGAPAARCGDLRRALDRILFTDESLHDFAAVERGVPDCQRRRNRGN